MNLDYDVNDVVQSLAGKLSEAQMMMAQYEAIIVAKEKEINELKEKLNEKDDE